MKRIFRVVRKTLRYIPREKRILNVRTVGWKRISGYRMHFPEILKKGRHCSAASVAMVRKYSPVRMICGRWIRNLQKNGHQTMTGNQKKSKDLRLFVFCGYVRNVTMNISMLSKIVSLETMYAHIAEIPKC